jgi:hypothetical protein
MDKTNVKRFEGVLSVFWVWAGYGIVKLLNSHRYGIFVAKAALEP